MHPPSATYREFHVSRVARDRYQFDQALFSLTGNMVFADFHAARLFAQRINQRRDLLRFPEQSLRAGQINAMGLIDEIMHYVVALYRQQVNPQMMQQAMAWLTDRLGQDQVDGVLRQFAEEFPALAVYRRQLSVEAYFAGETGGVPNREILLEELMLLWLANANSAFAPFGELFTDTALEKTTAYPQLISALHAFFDQQPPFGPDSQNLVDMLRSPAIAVPHSLSGQLEYIRRRWAALLGEFLFRLLRSLDLISEEEKAIFLGPGPSPVYEFGALALESERFSPDRDWMPSLVLIAKNAYVWLDQLSRQYPHRISHLDEIPDQELDLLARYGFTGLWLIGLWERSPASQRIKQQRGNPEAVASAYSVFDYQIAADLGGEQAYLALRERAWRRGIRMASDMVPNHMGIDSRWVIEHPEWFVSLDYSPFPSYSFNGTNLSSDEHVGIYLEDHYYDSTDAAVVFKLVDHWSGSSRYIYHGNDGTSMPWNDTGQLNYLMPDVREAVIQTILHVARKFPVIRFDAAMTLAKKHYQRLWFPEPGTGGAIPTRAEYGLPREQFDALFPIEFWREVVDRVAQEVPDTLLLAEAFWLMEGYFVRTLGMHRVYNSAFMNMLRDEKNQEYRLVMKNTLDFDSEILKRYVNFMNNPDERTAVDQFGKGDKYFGVCTLMCTLPGLPMFGHGQVEGYTEKYGMEFRRAYWDEWPDSYLVERHEREIFPLLRKRYLFAEVRDFLLYDFFSSEGYVNEDVFAYSNRSGDERSLVVYHNRFAEAGGWIRTSAAYSVKTGQGDERLKVQRSLGQGLGLHSAADYYTIFRDHVSGLEYLRESRAVHEQGLYVELHAYQYHVFLDFREVQDNEWRQYAHLAAYLDGRGVPSIDAALKELFLQPVLYPFRELVNAGGFQWLVDNRLQRPQSSLEPGVLSEVEQKAGRLLGEINSLTHAGLAERELASLAVELRNRFQAALELPVAGASATLPETQKVIQFILDRTGLGSNQAGQPTKSGGQASSGKKAKTPPSETSADLAAWGTLLGWLSIHQLGAVLGESDGPARSRSWIDEWLLGRILAGCLGDLGVSEGDAWRAVDLVRALTTHQDWFRVGVGNLGPRTLRLFETWFEDPDVQRFLHVNRYQGVLWFNKESYEQLLGWLLAVAAVAELAEGAEGVEARLVEHHTLVSQLLEAGERSGYRVEGLLEGV